MREQGLGKLAASGLSILAACIYPRTAHCDEVQTVLVTMDQAVGEDSLCHVHFKSVERVAPCTEIVAVMQSDPRIPAHAHVTLRGSKTVRYEQVSRLLQSLRDAEYVLKIGYITTE